MVLKLFTVLIIAFNSIPGLLQVQDIFVTVPRVKIKKPSEHSSRDIFAYFTKKEFHYYSYKCKLARLLLFIRLRHCTEKEFLYTGTENKS